MTIPLMSTYTGKVVNLWDLKPEMICIKDIAHSLATIPRYLGHTIFPYSVAEHSVRTSELTKDDPLAGLLHDSAEAYIGDILSPQKAVMTVQTGKDGERTSQMEMRRFEKIILAVIGEALGVPNLVGRVEAPSVKRADKVMLATETRDLMPQTPKGYYDESIRGLEPLAHKELLTPWRWQLAETRFLARYLEITNGNTKT